MHGKITSKVGRWTEIGKFRLSAKSQVALSFPLLEEQLELTKKPAATKANWRRSRSNALFAKGITRIQLSRNAAITSVGNAPFKDTRSILHVKLAGRALSASSMLRGICRKC
jgi:hypothetical protein